METKIFYGVDFKVYKDTKIDGNFIKPEEAVYFENDVEISGNLKVKYLKTGKSIKVSGNYEVDRFDEVGKSQEVGGDLKAGSSRISLYSNVGGNYEVSGKVFVGVCEWRKTTEEEETLTCGKFISGDIKYGKLKETGLPEKSENLSGKEVEVKIDGKNYRAVIQ
jgi:NDP-sugar pyrophosphorylase family protein